MSIQTDIVDYPDQDLICRGYLAYDDGLHSRRGTVLIAHAWEGRNGFVEDKARQLAELGYNGFALDMYGGGRTGGTPAERQALMEPILNDRRLLTRRVQAALEAVRTHPETKGARVVVIGYCFGGICALDLARSGADIAGAVTFHGGLKAPDFENVGIRGKILIFHADKDIFVPQDDFLALRDELNAGGVAWEAHIYGGVLHSFTNPEETDPATGMAYDDYAANHAWQGLLAFLARTLV